MLELGRKEHHLFGGIFVQILLVGLLVFAYTQAVRQLNHGREMFTRRQEQLTVARDQMARRPAVPDLSGLQGEVGKLKESFAGESELNSQLHRIERIAQSRGLKEVQVRKTDVPVDTLTFPMQGRADFEVRLFGLELAGQGSTRGVANLLAALSDSGTQPALSLATLSLRTSEIDADQPVQFSLRWLVPVLEGVTHAEEAAPARPPAGKEWGMREEPFLSPVFHSSALRVPGDKQTAFRLTGILWDSATPSCVINKQVRRPGEWVESYQVVLITRTAVVLQGLDQELVLHLS